MAQIICENVTLGYERDVVVSGLSFSVHAGDYLCIVGENGSGKSTLMKAVLGLLQPLSGTIRTGDGLKHNDVGYLPQQTPVQRDFPASVREIVLSGFQARKGFFPFYTKEEQKEARENMERMGILPFERRCYRELSGGQQQRVLLARALCAAKKILLLDEPVAGLDPKVTSDMYRLIDDLNRDGVTIIMVSHDIAAAVTYASHILHIGESVFFGTTASYLESAAGRLYLMRDAEKETVA
ncbi:MAG: metal ABC transporter ATP-binding protein [Lachnospiraceae bacterium]|nr:metal ABC transporter ATP-binding protein [Lachnospiraceae bacterium]